MRRRLYVAMGDPHNLAGWVCFDVGHVGSARVHFAQALVLAGRGRHNGLVAKHQLSARTCVPAPREPRRGSGVLRAGPAHRGRRYFEAADHTDVPTWARFFTETDLSAMIGAIHTDLALTVNPHHTRNAMPLLTEAVDGYGDNMARSRTFDQPPGRQGPRSRPRWRASSHSSRPSDGWSDLAARLIRLEARAPR